MSRSYSSKDSIIASTQSERLTMAQENYTKSRNMSAKIISRAAVTQPMIGLGFLGVEKKQTYQYILDLLARYKHKANFMVSSLEANALKEQIAMIQRHGLSTIGIWDAMNGMSNAQNESQNMNEILHSMKIFSKLSMKSEHLLYARNIEYTREICNQLGACGVAYGIKPIDTIFSYSFNNQIQLVDYVKQMELGGIYMIEWDETKNEKCLDMLQRLLAFSSSEGIYFTEIEQILNTGYLLQEVREEQSNQNATVSDRIATSSPYIGLSFRGLTSGEMMNEILKSLKMNHCKGTFYVTSQEMIQEENIIRKIIREGHEIGLGGVTKRDMRQCSWQEQVQMIEKEQLTARRILGMPVNCYLPMSGKTTFRMQQAAKANSLELIGYNKAPVRNALTTVSEVKKYFKKGLQRGDMISIPLDLAKPTVEIIDYVGKLIQQGDFEGVSVGTLKSKQERFDSMRKTKAYKKVKNNHIAKKISTWGKVVEKISLRDKVAFLTFDDWGSDATVNRILTILKKYRVRGSFFVRGNGVVNNPGLLRAIAKEGHDVGNHTYHHLVTTDLTPKKLKQEVVWCHQVITNAMGESPTLFFRPPTMATNERMNKTILETGITYIIRGEELSTHDYEKSAKEVVDFVLSKIYPGGIITMHMSDNSCSDEALPKMIEGLRQKGYRFAALSDYL